MDHLTHPQDLSMDTHSAHHHSNNKTKLVDHTTEQTKVTEVGFEQNRSGAPPVAQSPESRHESDESDDQWIESDDEDMVGFEIERQHQQAASEAASEAEAKDAHKQNMLLLYGPTIQEAIDLIRPWGYRDSWKGVSNESITNWLDAIATTNISLHKRTYVAMQKLQINFDYVQYYVQYEQHHSQSRQQQHSQSRQQARAQAQAQSRDRAQAQAQAQAKAQVQAQAKAQAHAQAKAQAQAQSRCWLFRRRKPTKKKIHITRAKKGHLVISTVFPIKLIQGGTYFHIHRINTYVAENVYDCEGTEYSAIHGIHNIKKRIKLNHDPDYLKVVSNKVDHEKFQRDIQQYQQQRKEQQKKQEQQQREEQKQKQEQQELHLQYKEQLQQQCKNQVDQDHQQRRKKRRKRLQRKVPFSFTSGQSKEPYADVLQWVDDLIHTPFSFSFTEYAHGSHPKIDQLSRFAQSRINQMYKQLQITPRPEVRARDLDQGQDSYQEDLKKRQILLHSHAQNRKRRRIERKKTAAHPRDSVDDYIEYVRCKDTSAYMTFQQYIHQSWREE